MKKTVSLLLTLCLLLGLLPMQVLAYVGDILPVDGKSVKKVNLSSGSLALQNDYLRVIVRQDGTVSTAPAADSTDPVDRQTPFCYFITYGTKHTTHMASLRPKSVKFVGRTPNGPATAIQVEYDLTVDLKKLTATGTVTVYYELVQISTENTWGVLTSVNNVVLDIADSGEFFLPLGTDVGVFWGYTLDGFTAMGHKNAADSPALKMNRLVYNYDKKTTISNENSVITSKIEGLRTWDSFSQGGDWCYDYITEVYTDGYNWANPFVGLSEYYKRSPINAYLPDTVSVIPASRPGDTRVECVNDVGLHFKGSTDLENHQRFLWGFRNLVAEKKDVPTKPDEVKISINAKRLAAFASGENVTVEYVADNAALETLKKQYGTDPVALISGNYESKNGAEFVFTGGAALLSPSVTATWDKGNKNNKLIIHKDGRVEQQGVSLNAPSFKFYQPKGGGEDALTMNLTKDGFIFTIDPKKNDAIVYVDIPYAKVELEKATADTEGNLVFSGNIGFQTIFNGLSFAMEKLGYGLNEKKEFKVNGVHATGRFDTAQLMALELAKVEGEVNTFEGEEKYAFSLELNVFDLFETEATLALARSNQDGSLIPDELYFFVAASPGIPLIPPIPVGQLNGGGAGFKDLADTVNGNYFAIPPLKLRGTLKGTYLHLIEGKGDVVLGPSEISFTASDVQLVGTNASVISQFGYALKLNGQERTYNGTTYQGIYFAGLETLRLNLPNNTFDVIVLENSVELGAFGGANSEKTKIYLGIGANGIVKGQVQVPKDVPVIGGLKLFKTDVNLVVGGQTTAPIRNVSVGEGMKDAFKKIDIYLGAMAEVDVKIIDARIWVLVPQIVQTNFNRGGGWDVEHRWIKSLPEWNWADHGVQPIVQSVSLEDGGEDPSILMAVETAAPENSGGENSETITVTADPKETPYILLAFDKDITEEQIQQALTVTKGGKEITGTDFYWVKKEGVSEEEIGNIDPNAEINATSDLITNNQDGKEYRMAILRLTTDGVYQVNTGALEIQKFQSATMTPFEELALNLNGNQVSGKVNYAETGTKYVLRTYFAEEKGGADYLIDEQTVDHPNNISVTIPTEGKLVPTGDYYVTSFLMTEKTFEMEDGTFKTALAGIDSQQFDTPVSYTNNNEPDAPENVTLAFVGNEVMTAKWDKMENVDGYAVTIYQEKDGNWVDTGFGYDLDKETNSINMALTVGGKAVSVSETGEASSVGNVEKLQPDQTYRVGVRAYKTIEGGKYYGAEGQSESNGVFLPKYTPLDISLEVGGKECDKDENGVFHAYVNGEETYITVKCDQAENITVTRMDKNGALTADSNNSKVFTIPQFTGTLMLRVDCTENKNVTSRFLLVSRDDTLPVLTLSDPIFYADRDTGKYTVTGTADAGSAILYNKTEKVYADSTGTFAISGTLEENQNSTVLSISAQDSAGNATAPQIALVARRADEEVSPGTFDGSGGTTQQTNKFVDVIAGSYYEEAVKWAVENGITQGTDATHFSPEDICTRAEVVTFLWRAAGSPKPKTSAMPFTDIPADSYYYNAVLWAVENGITSGTSDTTFSPDAVCTRAQIVTFLWKSESSPAAGSSNPFTDVAADTYYTDAVLWAAKEDITKGTGSTTFDPDTDCTRAQVVTFLWRCKK